MEPIPTKPSRPPPPLPRLPHSRQQQPYINYLISQSQDTVTGTRKSQDTFTRKQTSQPLFETNFGGGTKKY